MTRWMSVVAIIGLGVATVGNSATERTRTTVPIEGDSELISTHVVVHIQTRKLSGTETQPPKSVPGGGRRNQVERLEVLIDGARLFVPDSVFCDLTDVQEADLRHGQKGPILTLIGGDASESYKVTIEFDGRSAIRRMVESTLMPRAVTQESRYYLPELKDE